MSKSSFLAHYLEPGTGPPPPPPPPPTETSLLPPLTVEVAPGFGPLDGAPVWQDTTVYAARPVTIDRGRPTELDATQAGVLKLDLYNVAGRFTPGAPTAIPLNTPIRVTASNAGLEYPRFYGHVDSTAPVYGSPKGRNIVRVTAYDAQEYLGNVRLPESVWAAEIAADSPRLWLRLGEQDGQLAGDSSGSNFDGSYIGERSRVDPLIDATSDGATAWTGTGNFAQVANTGARVDDGFGSLDLTVEIVARITDATTDTVLFEQQRGARGLRIMLRAGGQIHWTVNTVTAARSTLSYSGFIAVPLPIPFGTRLHIVCDGWMFGISEAATVTINGALVASSITPTQLDATPPPVTAGSAVTVGGTQGGTSVNGVVDEVAVYPSRLSDARRAAHYAALTAPWEGDTTGERIHRILDLVGWPAALRSIDSGEKLLGAAKFAGRTCWDYLQQIADTEQGRLFVSRSGKVTFHGAQRDYTPAPTVVSFTETTAGVKYLADGSNFGFDKRFVVNEATGQRDGGSPVTVTTATGVTGVRSKTLPTLLVRTDAEVRNVTEAFVGRYTEPQLRVDGWKVRLADNPSSYWPVLLGLDFGDPTDLERATLTLPMHVEQCSESLGGDDWVMDFAGSPDDQRVFFTWGSSTWGGTDVWR